MSGPRFVATADVDGWRIKTYWVSAPDGCPRAHLVTGARRHAATILPDRPDRVGAFGVGFLVVHLTGNRLLAQLNWWMQPDELYQRAFVAPPDRPAAFEPLATAAIGTTSELVVTAHEGRAWSRHVIENPAGRDIDRYLTDVFRADLPIPA